MREFGNYRPGQPEMKPFDRAHHEGIIRLPENITPRYLLELNHSQEADSNRQEFLENKKRGALHLEWVCGDARIWRLLANETYYYNTVANGGNVDKLAGAVNHGSTKSASVTAHEPVCGGRSAKLEQIQNDIHVSGGFGLDRFVSCEIGHPSVLQAGMQARRLAEVTDKEVSAKVINHETGEVRVMAIFNRKDGGPTSHIPDDTWHGRTPQTTAHDADIPYLTEDELTPEVSDYMTRYNEQRAEHIASGSLNFDNLITQRPRMVKYGTDLRSAEVWLPDLAEPGNIFRLTTPRDRIRVENGKKITSLRPSEVRQAWEQASYAISYAVKHRGQPDESFSNTDTFLIALPDWSLAYETAVNLGQQDFMQDWLLDPQNRVLIAQNNQGLITKAAQVEYVRRDFLMQAAITSLEVA